MAVPTLRNPQSTICNPQSHLPLSDSPWFWILLFSLVALALLVVFGDKYRQRQTQLERQFQSKERREAIEPGQPVIPAAPYSSPRNLIIAIWPLALLLVAASTLSAVMLYRERCRVRGRTGTLREEGQTR